MAKQSGFEPKPADGWLADAFDDPDFVSGIVSIAQLVILIGGAGYLTAKLLADGTTALIAGVVATLAAIAIAGLVFRQRDRTTAFGAFTHDIASIAALLRLSSLLVAALVAASAVFGWPI